MTKKVSKPQNGEAAKLSHYDSAGRAAMVDVAAKAPTRRQAEASAFVSISAEALRAPPQNPKGNPLEVSRIAGISAAKQTSELIPMCHPLALSFVDVPTELSENGVKVYAPTPTPPQT